MKTRIHSHLIVIIVLFFSVVAPQVLFANVLEWKPGQEQVTLYLPEEALHAGDQVTLDGRDGEFVSIEEGTGEGVIVKLKFNGNTEYYQGVPKIAIDSQSKSKLPGM